MIINKELLKGSKDVLVLKLLARKDMYGYEITKEIKEKSSNVFNMSEGNLYPILHSLEIDGIVESYWEDTTSLRKRKYYRITERGKSILEEKEKEWKLFKDAVDNVLGGDDLAAVKI